MRRHLNGAAIAIVLAVLLLWLPEGVSLLWPSRSFYYPLHCSEVSGWEWIFQGCMYWA